MIRFPLAWCQSAAVVYGVPCVCRPGGVLNVDKLIFRRDLLKRQDLTPSFPPPRARSINGPLSMVWNDGLSSQVSQRRTDLLRVLTDAFAMSI